MDKKNRKELIDWKKELEVRFTSPVKVNLTIEGLEEIEKMDLSVIEVVTGRNDIVIQEKINEIIDKVNLLIKIKTEEINKL
jgi:methyl coenzyme M reductase subunit C